MPLIHLILGLKINRYLERAALLLVNNVFVNWLWVLLRKDDLSKRISQNYNWAARKFREDKSLQENVGYSDLPHITALISRSHKEFAQFAAEHLPPQAKILDIGCGTGLYLKGLNNSGFSLFGVDLNKEFLEKAKMLVPDGTFECCDFMEYRSDTKFDLIGAFGMLIYIEPSRIRSFFGKIAAFLNPGGYVYIIYPHALTMNDVLYKDLTYVRYSPLKIEKVVSENFEVVEHRHNYDGRKVKWFDDKKYYFPDGTNTRTDTIENSYLLIARKK